MGLAPGGLDDHKDHIRDLIERVSPCIHHHACHMGMFTHVANTICIFQDESKHPARDEVQR